MVLLIIVFWFMVVTLLDAWTTYYALTHIPNTYEGNKLIAQLMEMMGLVPALVFDVVATALILYLLYWMSQRESLFARTFTFGYTVLVAIAAVITSWAVINNCLIILNYGDLA